MVRFGPVWSGLWTSVDATGLPQWAADTPALPQLRRINPVPTVTLPPDSATSALLDVQAVAQLLDCSPRHVYRLSDAGRMPAPVKLGSLVRWSRQAIEEWIGSGCKPVRQAGRA